MNKPAPHYMTLLGMDAKKSTTLTRILHVTCKALKITPEQVKSSTRKAEVVFARHVYCYLASTGGYHYTLVNIGKEINRDHASVLHAKRKLSDDVTMYKDIADKIDRIKSLIDSYTIETFDKDSINSNHIGWYYEAKRKRALKIWSECNDLVSKVSIS